MKDSKAPIRAMHLIPNPVPQGNSVRADKKKRRGVAPPPWSYDFLAPIFCREYSRIIFGCFVDYLDRLFVSPADPPPFFSIGWAPKILDGNTRRNNRRKIIDVVLGTARDNNRALNGSVSEARHDVDAMLFL